MPTIKSHETGHSTSSRWAVTLRNGGSISHHHGIGVVRSRWLRHELGNALDVLRSIKAALDGKGILNVKKGMFFPG
ncbi:hypothetical protein JCM16161A_19840 [Vulcanisaeta sp. JCM 16161]|uniref:FAD-binding oxidoreductase n=1 Tax=Vulcanisaeta sp. JCM 16161 TaxID=1295372 RepID=UPI0006CF9169|nr:FAD-linked oxidase C-terminal domain-containing protein [Vulcanisaeta sp. JCM 16161]